MSGYSHRLIQYRLQSTLPQRERRSYRYGNSLRLAISTHTPTKGATSRRSSWFPAWTNFNPRSHKGSDSRGTARGVNSLTISTHAPTKGATACVAYVLETVDNFNPRSHKGSDRGNIYRNGKSQDFNPRSHKGSDVAPEQARLLVELISTHAPTKGATIDRLNAILQEKFQPTLPQRERL